MKVPFKFSFLLIIIACSTQPKGDDNTESSNTSNRVEKDIMQSILDSAKLEGSILIYDYQKDSFYSNDFEWAEKGFLPASTFKICNSIIALETGAVENEKTLFPWDGKQRNLDIWEKDMNFREAFHLSCVPCYQDIARKIGAERMNNYLDKLDYGNMIVDTNNLDVFWLEGESKISQFEQIDFLKRLYYGELPVSDSTTAIMKRLMLIDHKTHFSIFGKTGWALRNGNNIGWFVGYIENFDRLYFFAANVEPNTTFDMKWFSSYRKYVVMQAFLKLDLIRFE
jgi:beta-lactamase class D